MDNVSGGGGAGSIPLIPMPSTQANAKVDKTQQNAQQGQTDQLSKAGDGTNNAGVIVAPMTQAANPAPFPPKEPQAVHSSYSQSALESKQAGVRGSQAAAAGGAEGPKHPAGNPYLAPNLLAILSAALNLFYSMTIKAELGLKKAENKGMEAAIAQAETIAHAQIAAGEEESKAAMAAAVAGGLQAFAGVAGLSMMGKGATGSTGIRAGEQRVADAKVNVAAAENKVTDAATSMKAAETAHQQAVQKLEQMKASRQSTASVGPNAPPPATNKEIAAQERVVQQQQENLNVATKHHDTAVAAHTQAQADLNLARQNVYQGFNMAGQLSQVTTAIGTGFGQTYSQATLSQTALIKAEEEAAVTVGQTAAQLIQKGIIDAASQTASSMSQIADNTLKNLDKSSQIGAESSKLV